MRTTLVIPDPVARRAKRVAKEQNKTLSELFTEAMEANLAQAENSVRETPPPYRVVPRSMGFPKVDLSDRAALYDAMEESV